MIKSQREWALESDYLGLNPSSATNWRYVSVSIAKWQPQNHGSTQHWECVSHTGRSPGQLDGPAPHVSFLDPGRRTVSTWVMFSSWSEAEGQVEICLATEGLSSEVAHSHLPICHWPKQVHGQGQYQWCMEVTLSVNIEEREWICTIS